MYSRFGFLEFASEEKALEHIKRLSGKKILGRPIFIQRASIGNFNSLVVEAGQEEVSPVSTDFDEKIDDPKEEMAKKERKRETKIGKKERKEKRKAEKKEKRKAEKEKERKKREEREKEKDKESERRYRKLTEKRDLKCVFVGNLPSTVIATDLIKMFPQNQSIKIKHDHRINYAYAFINYINEEEAKKAYVSNDGLTFEGRRLKLGFGYDYSNEQLSFKVS